MSSSGSRQENLGVRIVPAEEGMDEAVERLRAGKLVAFPTETVYGLGANALDAAAVGSIFAVKGRPSTNPVIVHIAEPEAASALVRQWSDTAAILAERFWPGPLTLVLPKADAVPDIVTAGGDTVGVRIPAHPVARELLQKSGVPVAAPSANRSEEVSPTSAQHVADSLGPWVEDLLILDGGPCYVGVESTVLDVTVMPPRILRPGMITRDDLAAVLGDVAMPSADLTTGVSRSPGQMRRHYAPRVPVLLTRDPLTDLRSGDGFLSWNTESLSRLPVISMPQEPHAYAQRLYSALREMDDARVERIVIEIPGYDAVDTAGQDAWTAIWDRLRRAATPKEDQV